jgi:hypothetical protein
VVDGYKHSPPDINTIVGNLRGYLDNYDAKITELTTAINEIKSSPSWQDAAVKSSFISTCESYISIFTQINNALVKYVNYLDGKSSDGSSIENSFSKVIINVK